MKRLSLVIVSVLLFCLYGRMAQAQFYIEPKAEVGLQYYLKPDRDFQAEMNAEGETEIGFNILNRFGINMQFGIDITRYIKNESTVRGNLFQTEASKVLEFNRKAILSVVYTSDPIDLYVGGWIGRRSIHWMDRDCECFFNDFLDSTVEEVLEKHKSGDIEKYPGIAYHDGLRPYIKLNINSHNIQFEGTGPAYRWHAVTLPYNRWRLSTQYTYKGLSGGNVVIGNKMHLGGLREPSIDNYIYFNSSYGITVGTRMGSIPYPGYKDPLSRVSFELKVLLSKS